MPTESFVAGYINPTPSAIAYAGNVIATPFTLLSRYYDEEEILIPYGKPNDQGIKTPLYVVTANALVFREAFNECGGFDQSFKSAGGEDVDLGRRLWRIGNIEYAKTSVVLHDFSDGLRGFCLRFLRYGRGNRQLEEMTGITMRPNLRFPKIRRIYNMCIMLLQHTFLSAGYYGYRNSAAVRAASNGVPPPTSMI